MKILLGLGAVLTLCVGCILVACGASMIAPPTEPSAAVGIVEVLSPTPTVGSPLTPTATTTPTATATLTTIPTATRTPRPTATATATLVPLSGRIAVVAHLEDTDEDNLLSFLDNGRIVTLVTCPEKSGHRVKVERY